MTNKVLTVNQWKMLVHLKEYFTKFSNDKKLHNAINKEMAKILQRLQPAVYGRDDLKMFDNPSKPTISVDVQTKQGDDNAYILPNVLNGLKSKISSIKENEPIEVSPKWKNTISSISKGTIDSRTKYVLLSLATAESHESKLKRVESLLDHVKQFPEVKSQIVKEGGIRLLLRIQQQSDNLEVYGCVSEALSLLGYCSPLAGHGIRILSIDGGGIRGLLVIEMLRKLEELTGKRVHEMFDLVCGVSTGAIITCSIGILQTSMDELAQQYRELSTEVFKQSALWGTGNLVWSHSYYDTALFEKVLKRYFGDDTDLISSARIPNCPKLATVSAVVNQSHVSAYVFRNYALPWRVQSQYMGGCNHKIWEAVRASAAAPTYFEECKLGSLLHQDGGILVNNPTAVAIHEAKQLWPNHSIQCVVSFGTGRTVPGHPENINDQANSISSWRTKFMKILDSATDTEGVHTMLNDLLPPHIYYRFNPYLTEMLNMVETDPVKLRQLEMDAIMYLRRNDDKFQEAAKVLCETKGPTQKALDWLNLKREIIGISMK